MPTGPLTSEDLVEEDLDVVGCERLRRHDHFVQVALHQLRDHVSGRFGVKAKRLATWASTGQTARNTTGFYPPACVRSAGAEPLNEAIKKQDVMGTVRKRGKWDRRCEEDGEKLKTDRLMKR